MSRSANPALHLFIVPWTILLLASCSTPPAMPGGSLPPPDVAIAAPKAPPAPQAEAIPPVPRSPAGYFVWEAGHWYWDGENWVWISGHYVERPYQRAIWVPGSWGYNGNLSWTFTPGHWS
jgi:hypothetical protein